MKKNYALLSLFFCAVSAFAYDAQVDGIYYNLNRSNRTASVTDQSVFSGCYFGDVIIPESFYYSGAEYAVTSIGNRAFHDCSNLRSVSMPNSITSIGEYAFDNCQNFSSIVIPSSVTSLCRGAFRGCTSIASIDIPSSVTIIDIELFYGCSGLNSISMPGTITSIGNYAFGYCSNLRSIDLPNSVTRIDDWAFRGCSSLTDLSIPETVEYIGSICEYCTNLTSISVDPANRFYCSEDGALFNKDKSTLVIFPAGKGGEYVIPNSVTSIQRNAFSDCKGLTSVSIPNSISVIELGTFSGCSGIVHIDIPSSVTSIGNGAFSECTGLTNFVIPSSVSSIGDNAFYYCEGLTSITNYSTVPQEIDYYTFAWVDKTIPLYVPKSSVELYKAAPYWSEFTNIKPAGDPRYDYNGDGRIDVEDVTFLVNYILNLE